MILRLELVTTSVVYLLSKIATTSVSYLLSKIATPAWATCSSGSNRPNLPEGMSALKNMISFRCFLTYGFIKSRVDSIAPPSS